MDFAPPLGGFRFAFTPEPLQLGRIMSIDVDAVQRSVDIDSLQSILGNLTACTPRDADFAGQPAAVITRTVRIFQLLLQYLLYCQGHLQNVISKVTAGRGGGGGLQSGDGRVMALLERVDERLSALERRSGETAAEADLQRTLRAALQVGSAPAGHVGASLEEKLLKVLVDGGKRERKRRTRSRSKHRHARQPPQQQVPMLVNDHVTLAPGGFHGGSLAQGEVGTVIEIGREDWRPWAVVVAASGRPYKYWQEDLVHFRAYAPATAVSPGRVTRASFQQHRYSVDPTVMYNSDDGFRVADHSLAEAGRCRSAVGSDTDLVEIPGSGGFAESPATAAARKSLAARRQHLVDPITVRTSSPFEWHRTAQWMPVAADRLPASAPDYLPVQEARRRSPPVPADVPNRADRVPEGRSSADWGPALVQPGDGSPKGGGQADTAASKAGGNRSETDSTTGRSGGQPAPKPEEKPAPKPDEKPARKPDEPPKPDEPAPKPDEKPTPKKSEPTAVDGKADAKGSGASGTAAPKAAAGEDTVASPPKPAADGEVLRASLAPVAESRIVFEKLAADSEPKQPPSPPQDSGPQKEPAPAAAAPQAAPEPSPQPKPTTADAAAPPATSGPPTPAADK
eukprot:TRINITY_DN7267_c1_g2_i1.p1 TRINITY_DN7267_c1_g2~~TRINITY_DN7267_c1_g2_i1.p1  ORF type:complete len:647 (+),score=192.57 TRINITY_DN7267_c1_g2_i1:70-1941(+)